jgi:glycosyltransferase involved in cell wall biosynthesis
MGNRKRMIASVPGGKLHAYQKLLYDQLKKKGYELCPDFDFYLSDIFNQRKQIGIIHFHWISLPHGKMGSDLIRIMYFGLKLMLAKMLGYRIVWTAHNLFPHDMKRKLSGYLQRILLVHFADLVIVHFDDAKLEIMKHFKASPSKIVTIPHGDFEGYYPNSISRDKARAQLGISQDLIVFLYFGLIRPYKNIESLLESERLVNLDNILIVIAGHADDAGYVGELSKMATGRPQIRFIDRWIEDDEIQTFFNASDCVVLPYRTIFTSGAAMLARTYNRPVIMKACGFSRYYLNGRNSIILGEADPKQIAHAIKDFVSLKDYYIGNLYPVMYKWDAIGQATTDNFEKLF